MVWYWRAPPFWLRIRSVVAGRRHRLVFLKRGFWERISLERVFEVEEVWTDGPCDRVVIDVEVKPGETCGLWGFSIIWTRRSSHALSAQLRWVSDRLPVWKATVQHTDPMLL